ncbi:hypothetical protein HDU82_005014 [Entophlyctis luteolus]|nr:hypothetical protein HDU82_005014 [Entophlyctis luteolus]
MAPAPAATAVQQHQQQLLPRFLHAAPAVPSPAAPLIALAASVSIDSSSKQQPALYPVELPSVLISPLAGLFQTLVDLLSLCVLLFSTRPNLDSIIFHKPTQEDPAVQQKLMQQHLHFVHITNQQAHLHRCPNSAKMESMASHIAHLRSLVDAERSAHLQISKVHAKTQGLVDEQRDQIALLQGENESLKEEINSLSARLFEARFERNPSSNAISHCENDDEIKRRQNVLPASPQFQLRLDDDIFLDDCAPTAESDNDSENSNDEDSESSGEDYDCDEDDFSGNQDPVAAIFKSHLSETSDPQPLAAVSFESSTARVGMATQSLVQTLLANASPNTLPTILHNLAVSPTLALTPDECARAAITSLLAFITAAAPDAVVVAGSTVGAQELAVRARAQVRRHAVLLEMHCTRPGACARVATLDAVAAYCHQQPDAMRAHTRSHSSLLPWRAAFGMLVYVLVDSDVVEAADVVGWWAREKETGAAAGGSGATVYVACMEYMDKLCKTLEPYCSDSSDDDDDKDDDDDDYLDGPSDSEDDIGGSSKNSSLANYADKEVDTDEEEEEEWDDDSDLMEDGIVGRRKIMDECALQSANSSQRKVSFKDQ